jgi:RNA polymerase sigma-70 factor (ECF subfamily)
MSGTDPALVERVKSGDRDALAAYVAAHTPQLLSFIEKRMSDGLRRKVEPADVLQEVTISALNAFADIEWGDRDPFGWLCQQAERRIIDVHRHHFGAQKRAAGREVNVAARYPDGDDGGGLADLIAASLTSPSAAMSRQQKEFHILAAMQSLPDDARTALRLRYVEGLPSKEIADQLGRSDGAVRVLLTRSLQKLQEILGTNSDFQTLMAGRKSAGAG